MTISANDVIRVSIRISLIDGSDHVNVFHYLALGADASDAAAVEQIRASTENAYAGIEGWMATGVVGVDMKADIVEWLGGKWTITRNLGTVTWPSGTFIPNGAGDAQANLLSAVGLIRTSTGKTLGKKFLSGLVENATVGNVLEALALADFVTWIDDLVQDQVYNTAASTLRPVIVSTVTGLVHVVLDTAISAYLGKQGRRKPTVGS